VLPLQGLQTYDHLKLAAYQLIQDAAHDSVQYLEVRFAPMLSVGSLRCQEVLEAVVAGTKTGCTDFGIHANVIVCAMRHHSYETNLEMLKTAYDFLHHGVCALDLAGDENNYPTKLYLPLFQLAQKLHFPYTIHAGEQGNLENVKIAIQLGAKRLGHGIALVQDPNLMTLVQSRRIGIEMCPTSNLQTRAVKNYAEYPMGEFLRRGLLVTVNTDNRTVSDTSSTKEFTLVKNLYGESFPNLVTKLYRNAVEVSFADDSIKDRLLRIL
jgi:adenosine deaminase